MTDGKKEELILAVHLKMVTKENNREGLHIKIDDPHNIEMIKYYGTLKLMAITLNDHVKELEEDFLSEIDN